MRSLRSRVEICQGRWGRAEDLPRSMLHNSPRRTDCTNPAHLQCFSVAFCSKKVGFVSPLIRLDLSVHPIHSVKLLIGEPVISKRSNSRKEVHHFFRPSHKSKCQGGRSAAEMILTEMTARFLSDPFLLHHLRVALIAKLAICLGTAIFEDPRKCYLVVIYTNFYPISSSHEQGLVLGRIDAKGKDEIPGFLRLEILDDPLEAIPMDMSGKGGLTRQRESDTISVRLWRKARKHANSIGRQHSPIVMAGFGYENVRRDYAIEITPEAFATALGNPNISPVTALPPSIKPPPHPWTYDTVMFL